MTLPSSRTYATWLAIVRILTGAIWLLHGVPKFLKSDAFMPPKGVIVTYVQNGLAKTTGPYHDFLANVVQPHIGLFAELVRLGEVCIGFSLFFGVFTRLGGLLGVLQPLNYIAARGDLASLSHGWSSLDGALILLSAISFVLPTGRVLG
ncbi:MAG: DoxX family membrane protein, partial [Candidatus Baltobacteraceae bacterium]